MIIYVRAGITDLEGLPNILEWGEKKQQIMTRDPAAWLIKVGVWPEGLWYTGMPSQAPFSRVSGHQVSLGDG